MNQCPGVRKMLTWCISRAWAALPLPRHPVARLQCAIERLCVQMKGVSIHSPTMASPLSNPGCPPDTIGTDISLSGLTHDAHAYTAGGAGQYHS